MADLAFDLGTADTIRAVAPTASTDEMSQGGRLPRIALDAFCHSPAVRSGLEEACQDRRMSRVHATLHTGGITAAHAHYSQAPTPELLIVEASSDRAAMFLELAQLAEVCDNGTKVVVIGHDNDVPLYRALIDRGVADYLVAPLEVIPLINSLFRLYGDKHHRLGRSCAFIGAKGGVGSSTLAHNVAWSIAHRLELDTILADFDLPFGSAGLNFNIDAGPGLAGALAAETLDDLLLERLLSKRGERLGVLAAPGQRGGTHDLDADAVERLLEIAQSLAPVVVLDMPHLWTPWVEATLRGVDEVVVTATADLASLRNTKMLLDILCAVRPNDHRPRVVLNEIGVGKREEIPPGEFAAALECELAASIAFEAGPFSHSANKGQMIGEAAPRAKACRQIEGLAELVTGRPAAGRKRNRAGLFRKLWSRK